MLSPEHGTEVDPDAWMPEESGALVNRQIPPGRHFLRLVYFPGEGRAHFSDVVEMNARVGQARQFRLALKPGRRFSGALDDAVPRPVLNGRVDARVATGVQGASVSWQTLTHVEAGGSFAFDSLPPGTIKLIARCDGFASKDPPGGEALRGRRPQVYPMEPGGKPVQVEMERAATVHVRVKDEQGKPLAQARVNFTPNVVWGDRSTGLFGGIQLTTEQFLRMDRETRRKHLSGVAPAYHGDTDENGVATIANLPPGRQHFRVFCQGYETEIVASKQIIPGFREIELSAGEVREEEVVMHKARQ